MDQLTVSTALIIFHMSAWGVAQFGRFFAGLELIMSVFFVSGIDTGIGKTYVTAMMAVYLQRKGAKVITVKMVQTGNVGFSEDRDFHRKAMCKIFPEDSSGYTAPQIFEFPASPLFAAAREGKKVNLYAIENAVAKCAENYDFVLVEGAGGLCVPLTEDILAVDFAAKKDWPLILVSCGRLGSLNHTLLSLEAANARGLKIAGVVYNYFKDADKEIEADTAQMILKALKKACAPEVLISTPKADDVLNLPDIDFSKIFGI